MKKLQIVFISIFLFFCFNAIAFAHPGATDANGGHWDHSTGTYHYHHGYPAHSHEGGTCPYDFDDKTGQNSGTSNKNSSSENSNGTKTHSNQTVSFPDTSVDDKIPLFDRIIIFFPVFVVFIFNAVLERKGIPKKERHPMISFNQSYFASYFALFWLCFIPAFFFAYLPIWAFIFNIWSIISDMLSYSYLNDDIKSFVERKYSINEYRKHLALINLTVFCSRQIVYTSFSILFTLAFPEKVWAAIVFSILNTIPIISTVISYKNLKRISVN